MWSHGAREPLLGWRREGVAAFGISLLTSVACFFFFPACLVPWPSPLLSHPTEQNHRVFNIIHHVSGLFVVEQLATMDANATIMASPVASVGNDYNPQSTPSQIKYLADLCASASPWTVTFAILAAIIAYDQS